MPENKADELEMYRQIFVSSPDCIVFSKGRDGTYIDVSPGYERMTGWKREEVLGKAHIDGELWADKREWEAFITLLRRDKKIVDFRSTMLTRNGDIRINESSANVVLYKGEPVVVMITRDITERVRVEEELEQYREQLEQRVERRTRALREVNQRLQATNDELQRVHLELLQAEKMASIGQLAAGVAHEINNPIGFVHSNLGSLEGHMRGLVAVLDAYGQCDSLLAADGPELAKLKSVKEKADIEYVKEDLFPLLDECRSGLQRVKRIVHDLRIFSELGSGEWVLADLHAVMDGALAGVAENLGPGIEVVKDYGSLPQVESLKIEVGQVFRNVLTNAAYAIGERGVIKIQTGQSEDDVWITISDTGSGIATEHLSRIFDPFFTTKPVGTGTGLGLTVAYLIVQIHHGRIEVVGTPGFGASFRIVLPIRQNPVVETADD